MTQRKCLKCNKTETIWWKKHQDGFIYNPCYKHDWYLSNRGPIKRIPMSAEERQAKQKISQKKSQEKRKEKAIIYHQNRKHLKAEYDRQYRERNKEKLKIGKTLYFTSESVKLRKKEYDIEYRKKNNLIINIKRKKKKEIDIQFKLKVNLRSRLSSYLKKHLKNKKVSAISDLGCSVDQLKAHLESKFQEGMNWANYSKHGWHIDHIIPLSKFDLTKKEDQAKACHYTNLQPLWAIDNLKKGGKIV